jgi:hypothetical protein
MSLTFLFLFLFSKYLPGPELWPGILKGKLEGGIFRFFFDFETSLTFHFLFLFREHLPGPGSNADERNNDDHSSHPGEDNESRLMN